MMKDKIEWKDIEFRELTECLDNKRVPITESDRNKGEIPYYGANGRVGWINKFIFNEKLLLVAEDGGSWGKGENCAYIIEGKSWVNNHAHVLRIKEERTNIKFLMFWLNETNLNKYISGTTRGKLNQKQLNSIKIPLPFSDGKPDLKEQERIVLTLEKAEKVKAKGDNTGKLLDEYLKSVFNEMFYNKGFEKVRLGTICEINPKKSEISGRDNNFDVSFVPMSDVNEHTIYFKPKEIKKINEVYTGYTYFRDGDILLAKVTPCFENGKSAICKNLKNKMGFGSSEYHVLRPTDKILSELVYYFISDEVFIEAGKKQLTGTGGLRRLPMYYLENFKVPLPPIQLQQKFANIVEHVEKLKENVKTTKQNSEELFSSLMSKAFRGEL